MAAALFARHTLAYVRRCRLALPILFHHHSHEHEVSHRFTAQTLASVVGSEEEANEKIYSVWIDPFTGFGALISKVLSRKVKDLPNVQWVLHDPCIDVPNKYYGGDIFFDGKFIHMPQYRSWPM